MDYVIGAADQLSFIKVPHLTQNCKLCIHSGVGSQKAVS